MFLKTRILLEWSIGREGQKWSTLCCSLGSYGVLDNLLKTSFLKKSHILHFKEYVIEAVWLNFENKLTFYKLKPYFSKASQRKASNALVALLNY